MIGALGAVALIAGSAALTWYGERHPAFGEPWYALACILSVTAAAISAAQ